MEREPDKTFADDNLPYPDSEDGERPVTPQQGGRLMHSDPDAPDTMSQVDDRANQVRPDRNDYGQKGDKTR